MENPLEKKIKSLLEEIEPIQKTFGLQIINKDAIQDFVERPLVAACKVFWDKNIRTLESSANVKDIQGGSGYIGLDFNSLSEQNKEIAKQYGIPEPLYVSGSDVLSIRIPVSIHQSETVIDISNRAIAIAERFYKQKATWVVGATLEDYIQKIETNFGSKYPEALQKEKERLRQPGIWEEECKRKGLYFDQKTQTAWDSEELYRKAQENFQDKNHK